MEANPYNNDNSKTFDFVNETYDKLTYLDLYGSSVLQFLFISLVLFAIFSYCKIMQTKEDIANNWVEERCKPQNMLFAGFITHPEGTSAFQYTSDNFQYCVQNILQSVSERALNPAQGMIGTLTSVFSGLLSSLQGIREATSKLRNGAKDFAEDILGRILNVVLPIQKMFIALMDTFQKIQGSMTASLYTMMGTYYTLQALMGAILELIIKVLSALAVIIVGLWVMPMTWPAATATTSIFLAISIPLAVIIYFMTEVLHVKTSGIPKLRCFDEDTPIQIIDTSKNTVVTKGIKDVEVGDMLANGAYVTAKMKVSAFNLDMYTMNTDASAKQFVKVSGTHLIRHKNAWIRCSEHPLSTKIECYDKDYVYCLNTSNKVIEIGDCMFSDWDELFWFPLPNNPNQKYSLEDIHALLDYGFEKDTLVNGVKIQEIDIGFQINKATMVYGLVEVDAKHLRNYIGSQTKLYHLLTTNGSLEIDSVDVKDYNHLIDKFII